MPNFSMKQRCLWPVQLYTGHLLGSLTLFETALSRCLQRSYSFVESFCPERGGHKRPQGSYIMIFFKMLLGAWCLVSLVRIETMACHGVKAHCWLADGIYHRNHGLFVSCYVKSVWVTASVFTFLFFLFLFYFDWQNCWSANKINNLCESGHLRFVLLKIVFPSRWGPMSLALDLHRRQPHTANFLSLW